MVKYNYVMEGTAAGGQTWRTDGEVAIALEGDFPLVLTGALESSFMKLTQGLAIFGKPGVGCQGPYRINKFFITRNDDERT